MINKETKKNVPFSGADQLLHISGERERCPVEFVAVGTERTSDVTGHTGVCPHFVVLWLVFTNRSARGMHFAHMVVEIET